MKGTEGIDYVITECGHCTSTGKCGCSSCLHREGMGGNDEISDVGYELGEMRERETTVLCTICKGVGKVVFWREGE